MRSDGAGSVQDVVVVDKDAPFASVMNPPRRIDTGREGVPELRTPYDCGSTSGSCGSGRAVSSARLFHLQVEDAYSPIFWLNPAAESF